MKLPFERLEYEVETGPEEGLDFGWILIQCSSCPDSHFKLFEDFLIFQVFFLEIQQIVVNCLYFNEVKNGYFDAIRNENILKKRPC